jgi:hypothetical protein
MCRRDKKEEDEGGVGSAGWGIWPENGSIGTEPAGRMPVTENKININ